MTDFNITQRSSFLKVEVLEALRRVIDPELHINVVDLGLIYEVETYESAMQIEIAMTLSSPYCPMGETILQSVQNCTEHCFPGFGVTVKLVWEPQWSYEKISEEGRRMLGRQ